MLRTPLHENLVGFGLSLGCCVLLFGCDPNIYRVNTESSMCDSVTATDCKSAPPDASRIRLCGSAFANRSDFIAEAHKYCAKPVVENCAVQCCDVFCPPASALAPPLPPPPPPMGPAAIPPPAAADEMPPPPPPLPVVVPPPASQAAPAPAPTAPPAATVAPVTPAPALAPVAK